MKYSNFISRVLCFAILLAALSQYQVKASLKAQEEAENAAAVAEAEEYNREIRRQMSDVENASPYNDGIVNLNCGWESAININDVQRIVLGDLVLWESK